MSASCDICGKAATLVFRIEQGDWIEEQLLCKDCCERMTEWLDDMLEEQTCPRCGLSKQRWTEKKGCPYCYAFLVCPITPSGMQKKLLCATRMMRWTSCCIPCSRWRKLVQNGPERQTLAVSSSQNGLTNERKRDITEEPQRGRSLWKVLIEDGHILAAGLNLGQDVGERLNNCIRRIATEGHKEAGKRKFVFLPINLQLF